MATQTTIIEFSVHDFYSYFLSIGEEPTAGIENAKTIEELIIKIPKSKPIIENAFLLSSTANKNFDIVYKNRLESNDVLLVFQIIEGRKTYINQGWYKIVKENKTA